MNDTRNVLVARDVERECFPDLAHGAIARSLRPAIGIVIGAENLALPAMCRGKRSEDGLGNDRLHLRAAPIAHPLAEERLLFFAEELQAGDIGGFGIEVRIRLVIASRS